MVSNIQVQLPTTLEVGGTIVNPRLEKLRVVTGKISSKSILQSHFLQLDKKGFLKDVEVRLIEKTQCSNPSKGELC